MLAHTIEGVTRVTVVTDEGITRVTVVFERYGACEYGVELHLQDDGRTLKIFPLQKGSYSVR